jgi:hypothetical protein
MIMMFHNGIYNGSNNLIIAEAPVSHHCTYWCSKQLWK